MNKIAYKITLDNVKTKEEFFEFLLLSIKTIHFIFEDNNVIKASKDEDSDVIYFNLKNKIEQWNKEENHTQPFYPRSFIKKILKSGVMINYVSRPDNPDKMKTEDYGLNRVDKMKNFLLKRIDKDDEETGLKFKENSMKNDIPVDIYNAIVINLFTNNKDRLYIKFSVEKDLSEAFFRMNFISIHKDKNQNI